MTSEFVITDADRAAYRRDGYIIRTVLTSNEIAAFRAAADELMAREHYANRQKFFYIPFLLPEFELHGLHAAVHHRGLLEITAGLLQSRDLVFDNASVLCADPGTVYTQGWHRDVLQVPQDQIDEAMYSDDWRHNNVQINIALNEDSAFWMVPASHNRKNTPEENAAFAGSKHMSPIEAIMPGGVELTLQPGQAAFYNNNMIHRGYANPVRIPRRTLHIGYHDIHHAPTFHFYGYNPAKITPAYLDTLSPPVRDMVQAHLDQRALYPDASAWYTRPTW